MQNNLPKNKCHIIQLFIPAPLDQVSSPYINMKIVLFSAILGTGY